MSRSNDNLTQLLRTLSDEAMRHRFTENSILGEIHDDDTDSVVWGTMEDDNIFGHGGNDTIPGDDGDDYMDGGTGNDWMIGGKGNDVYVVDSLSDIVSEYEADGDAYDQIRTSISYVLKEKSGIEGLSVDNPYGSQPINLTGSNSNGNNGIEDLVGNNGSNFMLGLGGHDQLYGLGGSDFLLGGEGNDKLYGNEGNDHMEGGVGSDVYFVDSAFDDVIDVTYSSFDYDEVHTTASYDLQENSGIEVLRVEDARSTFAVDLTGSDSNGDGDSFIEHLTGNDGWNYLDGLGGVDILEGLGGKDRLSGGKGNDVLNGGSGDDLLRGEAGNDTLFGESGLDTFEFNTALINSGADKVMDFSSVDDTINLRVSTASTGHFLATEQFHIGSKAEDADDRVIYNNQTGKLYYDRDGKDGGAQVYFAILNNKAALSAADFFVFGF